MEEIKCKNCNTELIPGIHGSKDVLKCPNCHEIYVPSEKMSFRWVLLDFGEVNNEPNI
jgi:RNase P subunit RPR2